MWGGNAQSTCTRTRRVFLFCTLMNVYVYVHVLCVVSCKTSHWQARWNDIPRASACRQRRTNCARLSASQPCRNTMPCARTHAWTYLATALPTSRLMSRAFSRAMSACCNQPVKPNHPSIAPETTTTTGTRSHTSVRPFVQAPCNQPGKHATNRPTSQFTQDNAPRHAQPNQFKQPSNRATKQDN